MRVCVKKRVCVKGGLLAGCARQRMCERKQEIDNIIERVGGKRDLIWSSLTVLTTLSSIIAFYKSARMCVHMCIYVFA